MAYGASSAYADGVYADEEVVGVLDRGVGSVFCIELPLLCRGGGLMDFGSVFDVGGVLVRFIRAFGIKTWVVSLRQSYLFGRGSGLVLISGWIYLRFVYGGFLLISVLKMGWGYLGFLWTEYELIF